MREGLQGSQESGTQINERKILRLSEDFTLGGCMPRLLILKGLPASGKSTFAEKLEVKGWKVVEMDRIRKHIRGSNDTILRSRDYLIKTWLEAGKNVVSSDTNLHPKHVPHLKEIARSLGAEVKVTTLATPLKTCLERDKVRESPIGEKAIRMMYNRYIKLCESDG